MGTPCLACSFYTFYLSYNVQRILYKSRSVYCNVYLYSTSSVVYCWVLCIHAVVERVYAVEVQYTRRLLWSLLVESLLLYPCCLSDRSRRRSRGPNSIVFVPNSSIFGQQVWMVFG